MMEGKKKNSSQAKGESDKADTGTVIAGLTSTWSDCTGTQWRLAGGAGGASGASVDSRKSLTGVRMTKSPPAWQEGREMT